MKQKRHFLSRPPPPSCNHEKENRQSYSNSVGDWSDVKSADDVLRRRQRRTQSGRHPPSHAVQSRRQGSTFGVMVLQERVGILQPSPQENEENSSEIFLCLRDDESSSAISSFLLLLHLPSSTLPYLSCSFFLFVFSSYISSSCSSSSPCFLVCSLFVFASLFFFSLLFFFLLIFLQFFFFLLFFPPLLLFFFFFFSSTSSFCSGSQFIHRYHFLLRKKPSTGI